MVHDRRHRDAVCRPVNPLELARRLGAALGIPLEGPSACPNELVSREFPDVNDPRFRDLYLMKEMLRKFPGFDLGINTEKVALESFLEDEWLNSLTNDRLHTYDTENPYVSKVLCLAARKAVGVLGRFDWDEFLSGLRFGPGATTRLPAEMAGVEWKLSGLPHVHTTGAWLAREILSISPHWAWRVTSNGRSAAMLELHDLDRFAIVPKNAKTGRTIGIPPDLSIYMQLGMGYCIRSRLYHKAGIDLSDQTINQRWAKLGSIDGSVATLDVKSASNSLTCALVWQMLGNHSDVCADTTWFKLLEMLRTPGCLIDGKAHEYELFSAMGNGFTFELESLIFWALCAATCEVLGLPVEKVSVYGDDLIVPVDAVPLLKQVLGWCGFRLNDDKSFAEVTGSLFRESCGKHYLDGKDVSPFYVDQVLNKPDAIVLLANNLLRWATNGGYSRDGRVLPVYYWVLSHLREDIRNCRIPYGDANDGLLSDFDEACPTVAYERRFKTYPIFQDGFRVGTGEVLNSGLRHFIGYRVSCFEITGRLERPEDEQGYLVWLYNTSWRRFTPPKGGIRVNLRRFGDVSVPREAPLPYKREFSRKRSLRFKKRVVHSWPLIGPWVDETGSEINLSFELWYELTKLA